MSINHIGHEEIQRRKLISDLKSDTDDLTFAGASTRSRELSYKKVREFLEQKKIEEIMDDEKYWESLLQ